MAENRPALLASNSATLVTWVDSIQGLFAPAQAISCKPVGPDPGMDAWQWLSLAEAELFASGPANDPGGCILMGVLEGHGLNVAYA